MIGQPAHDARGRRYQVDIPTRGGIENSGRVFRVANELFGENSWIQVMLGQGLMPEQYHPIVDMMTDEELRRFLSGAERHATQLVDKLPMHEAFIDHYCRADVA